MWIAGGRRSSSYIHFDHLFNLYFMIWIHTSWLSESKTNKHGLLDSVAINCLLATLLFPCGATSTQFSAHVQLDFLSISMSAVALACVCVCIYWACLACSCCHFGSTQHGPLVQPLACPLAMTEPQEEEADYPTCIDNDVTASEDDDPFELWPNDHPAWFDDPAFKEVTEGVTWDCSNRQLI